MTDFWVLHLNAFETCVLIGMMITALVQWIPWTQKIILRVIKKGNTTRFVESEK